MDALDRVHTLTFDAFGTILDLGGSHAPRLGQYLKARGVHLTAEEVVAHCKAHLAGFKVPRAVVFGELPKTSTGKIQKFELRQRAGSASAIDL